MITSLTTYMLIGWSEAVVADEVVESWLKEAKSIGGSLRQRMSFVFNFQRSYKNDFSIIMSLLI